MDDKTPKEEWRDIGRRIEKQVKEELSHLADAARTEDWKETGKTFKWCLDLRV